VAPHDGATPVFGEPGRVSARFEHVAAEILQQLDRSRIAVLVTLTLVGVSASLIASRRTPFWHDEIFTILVSRLPSVHAIWRAALDGIDFFPPLNTLITHILYKAFGADPVVTRLPSIVSVWATSLIVFQIVRRRSNAAAGLTAFMLPFLTPAFRYSHEARGYGAMLALFAVSLFAWSEAARGNRRRLYLPMLALTVAASLWNHYFAVVTLVPLAVGEAVRLVQTRQPDWGMYAAFAVAGLLILPLVPLIRVAAGAGPPRWRSAGFGNELTGAYLFLMGSLIARRFMLLAAVAAAWVLVHPAAGLRSQGERRRLPLHEVMAGMTCLCIPAFAILFGIATGAFYYRYALPFIVGLAVVVPLLAWRLSADRTVDVLICLVFAATFGQLAVQSISAAWAVPAAMPKSRPVLAAQIEGAKPIVLTGVAYLQTWYYAPAEWRSRLWYVADPDAALEAIGTGTMDRNLLVLRKYAPINVADYRSFIANERRFVVFFETSDHWLLRTLRADGAAITLIGRDGESTAFDVSFDREAR
jgi:hypothetical protein